MQTPETFSIPRSLQPSLIFVWLCKLVRIDLIDTEQLSDPGVILLIRDSYAALFRAIYARYLGSHRGLFIPSWHGDETRRDYVAYLKNKYDALITVPADDSEGRASVRDALRLARTADALIFPVGMSIIPQITLPGERHMLLPLPGARVAVVIEAPFKTAEHPEQIPTSWHKAVVNLLDRADAQAQSVLQQDRSSPD